MFSKAYMGSAASKFPYYFYCDNEICMLRKNEWYVSLSDFTYTYRVSMKNKYPALVLHVKHEDFCKTMFKYMKTHIYGQGKIFLFVYDSISKL